MCLKSRLCLHILMDDFHTLSKKMIVWGFFKNLRCPNDWPNIWRIRGQEDLTLDVLIVDSRVRFNCRQLVPDPGIQRTKEAIISLVGECINSYLLLVHVNCEPFWNLKTYYVTFRNLFIFMSMSRWYVYFFFQVISLKWVNFVLWKCFSKLDRA